MKLFLISLFVFISFGLYSQTSVISPGGFKTGTTATTGQTLVWNGSAWVPGQPYIGTNLIVVGTGSAITGYSGFTFNNTTSIMTIPKSLDIGSMANNNRQGVYFDGFDTNWGLFRESAPWSAPDYARLKLMSNTGLLFDIGNTFGKSYFDFTCLNNSQPTLNMSTRPIFKLSNGSSVDMIIGASTGPNYSWVQARDANTNTGINYCIQPVGGATTIGLAAGATLAAANVPLTVFGGSGDNQSTAIAKIYNNDSGLWIAYDNTTNTSILGSVTEGVANRDMAVATMGGNFGVGILPTAKLHSDGTVRLQSLPYKTSETNVLWSDASGNIALGTAPGGIGAFNATGTPNGLSNTSGVISLHAADASNPGAVTLADQVLGTGTKTISKNGNTITIPLIIENNLANVDEEGSRIQFRGVSSGVMGSIISSIEGGSIAGGVVLDVLSGSYKALDMHSITRVTSINGFKTKDRITISGSYDITAALANRVGFYNIITGGGTLTLPDPATLPDGTVIEWAMTALSGSATTVNTPSVSAEFWLQNALVATSSYSIPTGVVRKGTFEVVNISGAKWVVSLSSGGDLDLAYNSFGPTASKINVDAAEGQTGGLEFESTSTNNIVFDMAGTGDFSIQDAGTNVFEVADNGYLSVGAGAPTTLQKLLATENSSSQVTVPIRVRNNGTNGDGVGVAFPLAINANDNATFVSLNPVGSITSQFLVQVGEGGSSETYISITPAYKETRFENATAREVFNGTSTTLTLDGRVSVVRVPTSATTTTITLPEIVSGVPGSNQVSVGYDLFLTINRAAVVAINRSGGADVIIIDGSGGSNTTVSTTTSVVYAKRLIATAADEWTIF